MKRPAAQFWICTAVLAATGIAAEPQPLANNPFDRPPSIALLRSAPTASGPGSAERSLELRSTMVGPGVMLADVGGRILRPGDSVGDFELLRVYEDRAVFRHNNNPVTLFVKPKPEKSDD